MTDLPGPVCLVWSGVQVAGRRPGTAAVRGRMARLPEPHLATLV